MKRSVLLAAAAAAAMLGSAADAALYVSGDSNIFTNTGNSANFTQIAANQRFLLNIAGGNVLIQGSSTYANTVATEMGAFLTTQSIANTVLASTATITAADLAGRSLFVGYLPSNAYTTGELAALSSYLAGGGSIIFTGENANTVFVETNAAINAALASFGSSLQLVSDTIGAGYMTATVVTANAATAGTTGFQYAATSRVTGGTGLYATTTGVTFVASAGQANAAVPEPATWAMMIGGFGLVGASMRRRKVSATVRLA